MAARARFVWSPLTHWAEKSFAPCLFGRLKDQGPAGQDVGRLKAIGAVAGWVDTVRFLHHAEASPAINTCYISAIYAMYAIRLLSYVHCHSRQWHRFFASCRTP